MHNLKENKAFCILPFVHLHVDELNNIKLCCVADKKPIGKYTQDFDFKSDPRMQEIRTKLLNGERIPHCQNCYDFEDNGAESSRTRDTADWFNKLNISSIEETPIELYYYDIRNDNLCNLGCRMCSPRSSSQIEKEFIKIGLSTPQESQSSIGFNQIVDLSTVKQIYISGGEPSIMPQVKSFLKRAVAEGRTDIEIRMNTNATNINKEYRDILLNFKNLSLTVSMDGHADVNKYIRWPSNWDTIIKNVHGLYQITNNLSFNVTVGIWNISNLSKLIFFLEKEFERPKILLNRISNTIDQDLTTFPNKELVLQDLELIKQSNSYLLDTNFSSRIDYYITEIQTSPVNLTALAAFFKFNDALDTSREIKLIDYIPELEACRELLTKQTSNTNAE